MTWLLASDAFLFVIAVFIAATLFVLAHALFPGEEE